MNKIIEQTVTNLCKKKGPRVPGSSAEKQVCEFGQHIRMGIHM